MGLRGYAPSASVWHPSRQAFVMVSSPGNQAVVKKVLHRYIILRMGGCLLESLLGDHLPLPRGQFCRMHSAWKSE